MILLNKMNIITYIQLTTTSTTKQRHDKKQFFKLKYFLDILSQKKKFSYKKKKSRKWQLPKIIPNSNQANRDMIWYYLNKAVYFILYQVVFIIILTPCLEYIQGSIRPQHGYHRSSDVVRQRGRRPNSFVALCFFCKIECLYLFI